MPSTVGAYLATRLEQLGLTHHFVVPGDYNLLLLDQLLANPRLTQVGCCNELNAAYAAEGYARARGAAALVVTYNVGAFSALNGVAGAYAEHLPVLLISGGPNTNDRGAGHRLHHTLGTEHLHYQYEIFRQVTCEAVQIAHAQDAPHLIDRAIAAALREQRPAYIEIPCNLAAAPCAAPSPFATLRPLRRSDPGALDAAVAAAAALLAAAAKPLLLAGPRLRPAGAGAAFARLAEALGCAVAVMPSAKGMFPEDHPQFIGVAWGPVSSPGCGEVVDWADLVLAAGPLWTDYSTVGWTAQPRPQRTIDAEIGRVRLPDADLSGVELAEFLVALAARVAPRPATLTQFARVRPPPAAVTVAAAAAPLTRAELARQVEAELDGRTTLVVETGDSWFNGMYAALPTGGGFEIEMQWGSIGWSVPATLGLALGLGPQRRVVTMVGDGSFQLTAQEVSTLIRARLPALLLLINNGGYTIEVEIHDGPYNRIKNWDYAGLIDVFNAADGAGLGLRARSGGELAAALVRARDHQGGPVLIECLLDRDDCSRQLLEWGRKVADANAR